MSSWVLLRGLARGSGHWGDFPAVLQQRLGGIRVVTLDLPGNGTLHDQRSPTRIEALAEACRERMRALDAAPPYHLLAVSLGAMVALEWAARAPADVAGCVLVNTSVGGLSPWTRRLRPATMPTLLAVALSCGSARHQEAAILRLTSRNPQAAAAVVERWAGLRTSEPVARLNAARQLLAAARYRPPARPPAVPLLLLGSRGDALVVPRCSCDIARRWGGDSALHPSAGHDLTLDDGAWVAAQVERWLAARAERTGETPTAV